MSCFRKYFPGGQRATILLGPEEELRDTIPKKILYENSSFFNDHYDTVEAEDWKDDTVKLPDVDPQLFDLAIQCLVSKDFTLEPDPVRSKSSEITILLDLMSLAAMLGLPDPSEPINKQLRDILINDRRALRRMHIRKAFRLDDKHGIQELFVKAVVREYMQTRSSRLNSDEIDTEDTGDTDDDDDDEERYRDGAHRAFQAKYRFSFQKELSTIRAFKHQLLEEQDNVLNSGKKFVARSGTRLRNVIYSTKYADPLDGELFTL
jgi:hypothetical protein